MAARITRRLTHRSRGSAMFLLLILAVVLSVVLAGIYSYISTSGKLEKRSNYRLEGTYAADYAFEQAWQQLNTLLASDTQNAPDVSHITAVTNLASAPTGVFGSADGYTWKTFTTVPVENGYPVESFSGFNASNGVYKYLTIAEFTRTVPGMTAPVHMQFQREWNYVLTPLFQYAIFYDADMELFPGAQFTVSGKVHTNGTLYTGTSASITFNDKVTYVNGMQNNYSPNDPRTQGTLNAPTGGTPSVTTRQNPPGSSSADTSDANHNNDGPRELIEIPDYHSSDPLGHNDRLYNYAGLKVLVNSTGTVVTSDSGVSVPANGKVYLAGDGTIIPSTDPLATYLDSTAAIAIPAATPTSSFKVQDYREGASIITTNVNAANLKTAQDAGGLPLTIPNATNWPNNNTVPATLKNQPIPLALRGKTLWNGALYVADITNSSSHRVGVRIKGSVLPAGNGTSPAGLTVATPNAAFIQGDYNTGASAPPVDSGTNLGASNFASGYTVQPAAVMADAVTILSSAWSDTYTSSTGLNSRVAANTTVNAALVSGIVSSVKTGANAAYSGGVENYPRLLEDWGSKRLTYYGSMVNLFQSQQSTAKWITTGTYYQAPTRNWYFDTNFLDPNKLPPGTPVVRSLMKGQWVQIE